MDDRNYGPADGNMDLSGLHFGDGPPHDDAPGRGDDFDFAAFTRSLNGDTAGFGVWSIAAAGVFLALTIMSFWYGWPGWARMLCVIALLAVALLPLFNRQPVAPVELTAAERERVERVLGEHGPRSAIALVRALYPGEPSASAARTVRMLVERKGRAGA